MPRTCRPRAHRPSRRGYRPRLRDALAHGQSLASGRRRRIGTARRCRHRDRYPFTALPVDRDQRQDGRCGIPEAHEKYGFSYQHRARRPDRRKRVGARSGHRYYQRRCAGRAGRGTPARESPAMLLAKLPRDSARRVDGCGRGDDSSPSPRKTSALFWPDGLSTS
jgi:hypothetical protein